MSPGGKETSGPALPRAASPSSSPGSHAPARPGQVLRHSPLGGFFLLPVSQPLAPERSSYRVLPNLPWLPRPQTHNGANAAPPEPMPMILLQDPVHAGLPPDPPPPTEPTAWLWGFNVFVKWAVESVACFCSLLVSGYAGVVCVSCKGLEGPGLSQLSKGGPMVLLEGVRASGSGHG